MSKCKSKRAFDTEDLAVEALIQTHIRFENTTVTGIYNCMDCGLWHVTSKSEVDVRLQEAIDSGYIKKGKKCI